MNLKLKLFYKLYQTTLSLDQMQIEAEDNHQYLWIGVAVQYLYLLGKCLSGAKDV
jgi:hypothetical protein